MVFFVERLSSLLLSDWWNATRLFSSWLLSSYFVWNLPCIVDTFSHFAQIVYTWWVHQEPIHPPWFCRLQLSSVCPISSLFIRRDLQRLHVYINSRELVTCFLFHSATSNIDMHHYLVNILMMEKQVFFIFLYVSISAWIPYYRGCLFRYPNWSIKLA